MTEQAVSAEVLKRSMERLTALLDFWEDKGPEVEDKDAEELFSSIFCIHDYATDGNRKVGTVEFGSFKTETAVALYRLLFLVRPKRVSFDDMYKSCGLFSLVSPDYEFVATPQFFKYELGVYLSAAPQHVEGPGSGIIGGWPGCDNGRRAKTPELKQWSELLERCLSRKWMVYGGNNFEV